MAKTFQHGLVPNTCGMGFISFFRPNALTGGTLIKDFVNPGGAGWLTAGFTSSSVAYKEAYQDLHKKHKIVFQSKPRVNTRTGAQFFIVVYDTNSKVFKTNNAKYEWPL